MQISQEAGFVLCIDGRPIRPIAFALSLEEAKGLATKHLCRNHSFTIESYVAPAPTQRWVYDHAINNWVEQR